MKQLDKRFLPDTLAVRAGDSVEFENLDAVFHNVFSLDKANAFDLGLYKGRRGYGDDKRTEKDGPAVPRQVFPGAGKFLIYCNIHPDMIGTVHSFGHGYFAQTDREGGFTLTVPDSGKVTVVVDGPRLGKPRELGLDLSARPALLEVPLELKRRARVKQHDRKDGSRYGGY